MLFSHPAFLWGLLAIAIPVVIHLFNIRRYRKVYFSNVERLSELQTEQRRRSTLRNWLLLALRVLAVCFLVLAFAQPVIPTSKQTVRTGTTVVSIYIDNSFSMENASSEGNQLDAARQKAREIVDAYSVSDQFQLLTNDMTGNQMRWLNRDEMLTAIDEIEISPASRMMSEVVTRQSEFMRQRGATNRHAYLISDFQQSTANLEALPTDSNAFFTLVPLSAVATDNLFVDTLILDAPAYFVGGSVAVEILLTNNGSHDIDKAPVKLTVDGRERAVATVDVAAGGTARTTLVFRIDHTGWLAGCVTIEDYPVTFDDNYFFSLYVDDRIHVLEIDGSSQPNELLQRLFTNDSSIDYRHAPRLQHDLTQFDFVILNEAQALASGEVQQLTQWILDGGCMLVIPSETRMEGTNELLAAVQAPHLDRWVQRQVKSSEIDFEGSLFRGVFSGHAPSTQGRSNELEMPTVQGHYTLSGQAIKQSIITLADGTDLLCVTPAGEGHLYLFTTPLTDSHTDFVNQALFVPTLYNMALYSHPLPVPVHTLGDKEPIVLQGTYDLNTRQPELRASNSEFRILPDLRRVGGRQQLVLHGELTHDGIYLLDEEKIAFNYPRRESRMEFLDRREIAQAIDGNAGFSLVRNSAKPLTGELRARDGGRQLWRLCILLALLALAAEVAILKLPLNHHSQNTNH